MAVKTAAFLLISAGDKNNYRVAQSKKKTPLHGQYCMNKIYFLYHVFLSQWVWVKQQKEVGRGAWEQQKDSSLPTDNLWYTPASVSFLLMSAKKPTLLSSL